MTSLKTRSIPIVLFLLFVSTNMLSAAGRETVNGWYVRWSDMGKYSAFAMIQKTDYLADIRNRTQIMISVSQDDRNEVGISADFFEESTCEDLEEEKQAVADINGQPVKMILTISTYGKCRINHRWRPMTKSGKSYLRSAFNSGELRFVHDLFDHKFDTRDHVPAYRLMKKMVKKEEQKMKRAL